MPETEAVDPMAVQETDPGDVYKSYNFLRLGLVLATLMLGAAVFFEMVKADCLQNSFSAYYYTPVRAVFVGALVAVGLTLIVIKGHGVEDFFLDIAGFLAPLVAFVPTINVGKCYSVAPEPLPVIGNDELAPWVIANISNNVFALIVAGVIAVVASWVLYRLSDDASVVDRIGLSVITLLIAVGGFLYWSTEFTFTNVGWTHNVAAMSMFAFLAAAAITNGVWNWTPNRRLSLVYLGIASAMGLSALLFLLPSDKSVLYVEAAEIVLFATYWLVQTKDHWADTTP